MFSRLGGKSRGETAQLCCCQFVVHDGQETGCKSLQIAKDVLRLEGLVLDLCQPERNTARAGLAVPSGLLSRRGGLAVSSWLLARWWRLAISGLLRRAISSLLLWRVSGLRGSLLLDVAAGETATAAAAAGS